VLALAVLLSAALWPAALLPQVQAMAHEVIAGGLGGMVLPALLLALTALLGTLALTAARFRYSAATTQIRAAAAASARQRWSLAEPGFAARQGQALIIPLGALLIWLLSIYLWPATASANDATAANVAAAFVFALAFVSLVAERVMYAFPAAQLPEAPSLRRLLLLTTVLLAAAACVELGRADALTWVRWPGWLLACVPALVVLELTLRALARTFLPAPNAADAKAVTDSIVAGVLTGGPRAPGTLLRTHFGLDFARSFAVSFLSAAILPAIFATALLCWILSGLKLIELGQRGIYERFGAPVAVMGPGLHLLLPWPLGRMRPVEYGEIHSVAIGVDQSESQSEPTVGAEATPPASLNRLWESSHPGQADYLVPSAGSGEQGFQSVSTEISVLYRVGLTDAAALQSVYTVADPESLVREAAGRLVLRFFNSRTLDAVLGARRENVAGMLRAGLTADIDSHQAGIEIVSVLIEEIHPPAGAAAAYHAVQAAQINANASISDEQGRAERTAGVAQQEAHGLTTAADAQAVETLHAANADAYRFNADRRAYAEGGQSFLLERSYANLTAALTQTPLTIIDHRLSSSQGPIVDLRSITAPSRSATTAAATTGTAITGTAPAGEAPRNAATGTPTAAGAAPAGRMQNGGGASGALPSIVPEIEDTN